MVSFIEIMQLLKSVTSTEYAPAIFEKQTIQRPVTTEEICNIVSFFSSPESKCITGQVIHVGLVC